jgi:hypothetical protein
MSMLFLPDDPLKPYRIWPGASYSFVRNEPAEVPT